MPASLALDADATSLRVREGTGGMQALGDDDKANIEQTIDDEVLKRTGDHVPVDGRARPPPDGSRLSVQGELTLAGETRPIAFDVARRRRRQAQRRRVVVKQTDWGIKPYSALFGALKVADEVEVAIDAGRGRADQSR